MDAFDITSVLTIVKDVGIATFAVVISAYFILLFIKLFGGMLKSSDNRWDDIIKVLQEQLNVQRDGNKAMADLNLSMQAGFSAMREELDKRIDKLESRLDQIDADVKRVLLIIGEDKADG